MSANVKPKSSDGLEPSQTEQSAPDPRDALIERLERSLADERQHATTLRETLDSTRFKADILEKSYAKQLTDTRARLTNVEQALAEQTDRAAQLEKERDEQREHIEELHAELEALTAKPGQTAKPRPTSYGQAAPKRWDRDAARQTHAGDGTINQLISNATWVQDPEHTSRAEGHLQAQVAAAEETPVEDMLAPELVFTGPDKDDGER